MRESSLLQQARFLAIRATTWLGTILVVGIVTLGGLSYSAQAQTPGDFDTSFNTSGRIFPHFGFDDEGTAIVLQPDGKIVVAGRCEDSSSTGLPCLTRLTSTGSYDPSFTGPSGTSVGSGRFRLTHATVDSSTSVLLALQPDGKFILVASNLAEFWVARLMPNGDFDTSFTGPSGSAPGYFVLPMPGLGNVPTALLLQPDGRIVIGGYCTVPQKRMCLARMLPSGAFDPDFDGPLAPGNGKFLLEFSMFPAEVAALALDEDGRLLVGGKCQNTATPSDLRFCLARLNPTGGFDATLGVPSGGGSMVAGSFLLPIGSTTDVMQSVLVQPDGHIIMVGHCDNPNRDFCAARIRSNGAIDTSFDGPSGTGDGKFMFKIGVNNDNLNGAVLQADGKLILYGSCAIGADLRFCLARLNHDGSLDVTYDGPAGAGNGKFDLPGLHPHTPRLHSPSAAALQPDGKLVLAGSCFIPGDYDFCIARLHGGPHTAKACSLDLDGDGQITATRDALMLSRIALGMTGTAVTNGISFATHATRTSWTTIRRYLVSQCGMALP